MSTFNQNKQAYIAVIHQAIASIDQGKVLKKSNFSPEGQLAYAWELLMQTLRWYPRYHWVLDQLVQKPIKKKYRTLEMLLVVALIRIDRLREANHHVVNHTVELAKALGFTWATAMVNRVLRDFLRKIDSFHKAYEEHEILRYAQPQWVVSSFKKRWPEHTEALLAALQDKPLLWVNCFTNREQEAVKKALSDKVTAVSLGGVDFFHANDIGAKACLEACAENRVYIQDLGAQMLRFFLHALPDVGSALDACAAPGGKSFILLKHYAHLKLTCADVDEARLATLMSNLAPIKSPIPVCFWIKDALSPTPKPHRLTYDLVLLDAPCSGSGVMKRHPEKKYQPWRLGPLVEVQKKLLETLWESVTPGGYLLYATCSILPEENEKIIDAFLSEHANGAALVDVALPIGFKCKSGWQILPSSSHDGHYFALIKKN